MSAPPGLVSAGSMCNREQDGSRVGAKDIMFIIASAQGPIAGPAAGHTAGRSGGIHCMPALASVDGPRRSARMEGAGWGKGGAAHARLCAVCGATAATGVGGAGTMAGARGRGICGRVKTLPPCGHRPGRPRPKRTLVVGRRAAAAPREAGTAGRAAAVSSVTAAERLRRTSLLCTVGPLICSDLAPNSGLC